MERMSYVFQFEDALHYNDWFASEPGRTAFALEKDLLQRLWDPGASQSVLEVGCGTGLFLEWFAQGGHQVTGLDPSPYMLNLAQGLVPKRVALDRGHAEDLPYEDNAFDTVALITALEFVNDPQLALQEALRVARRQVLLGVLNKYSVTTWHHCLTRIWQPSVYRHARFFSVCQLRHMVTEALAGTVPMHWRTCLFFPLTWLRYLCWLETSRFLQWLPCGHFIAMRIDLRYPLRTVQQPVFYKMPSRVGQTQPGSLCCRNPGPEGGKSSSSLAPGQLLLKIDGGDKLQVPL
jgi:SAM-dependent methyltransferase